MTKPNTDHAEAVFEELSAYLDGELEPAAVRQVEERLARDEAYRGELKRLEQAWGLLDRLPRATIDDAFTQTTMEMVAVAASQEVEAVPPAAPRARFAARIGAAVALLLVGLAGFALGQWMWPDRDALLVADYPVLKNFELYYQADDIEFLRLLRQEGLFLDGNGDQSDE